MPAIVRAPAHEGTRCRDMFQGQSKNVDTQGNVAGTFGWNKIRGCTYDKMY